MSNLKQIGLGMTQYTQDYDEKLLIQTVGTPNRHFGAILQPYLKSRQIFLCPSAAGSAVTTATSDGKDHIWTMADVTSTGAADPFTGSYGMNLNVGGGTAIAAIRSVATLGMFFDSTWPEVGGISGTATNFGVSYDASRHFDGMCICYADGHAKWLNRPNAYKDAYSGAASDPSLIYP